MWNQQVFSGVRACTARPMAPLWSNTAKASFLLTTRRICSLSLLFGAIMLAGCSSPPSRPPLPDDSFCRSTMKPRRLICIAGGVPSAAAAAQAAGLAGTPGMLTVYIVRNSWSDSTQLVDLKTEDGAIARTLPRTFARLQLMPGQHSLRVSWKQGESSGTVHGGPGEVKFLQLKGWAFWTSREFTLEAIDRDDAVGLSREAKFVADVVAAPHAPWLGRPTRPEDSESRPRLK